MDWNTSLRGLPFPVILLILWYSNYYKMSIVNRFMKETGKKNFVFSFKNNIIKCRLRKLNLINILDFIIS